MQTFLCSTSPRVVAQRLDNLRLNKQITEAFQIRDTLSFLDENGRVGPIFEEFCNKHQRNPNKLLAWAHHPAVLQWIGYENFLNFYIFKMHYEWVTIRKKNYKREAPKFAYPVVKPNWLGPTFVDTHKSSLLRKDRDFYGKYGWEVEDVPYYWPWVWSPKSNSRLFITQKVYKNISRNGDEYYKKCLGNIKTMGSCNENGLYFI